MKLQLWKETEKHVIGGQEVDFAFDTAEVLKSLVPGHDSAFGYTVENIRQRGKLLDQLVEGAEEIEVSKEMAAMLLERIKNYRVSVPSLNMVKLSELLEKCQ